MRIPPTTPQNRHMVNSETWERDGKEWGMMCTGEWCAWECEWAEGMSWGRNELPLRLETSWSWGWRLKCWEGFVKSWPRQWKLGASRGRAGVGRLNSGKGQKGMTHNVCRFWHTFVNCCGPAECVAPVWVSASVWVSSGVCVCVRLCVFVCERVLVRLLKWEMPKQKP